jgi:hypothetical protein
VDRFEALLREKIGIMYDMMASSMTQSGLTSFDEYKYSLGYLHALRAVLAEMETVADDMRK